MSRIGTKKPPIKNAYYAPQEHVPSMHANAKKGYFNTGYSNTLTWEKDDYKGLHIDKD